MSSTDLNDNNNTPLRSPDKYSNFIWGNLCILIAAIFWGLNVTVTKALIPEWMNADAITAVRLVGGAVLMWIASLFVKCQTIERQDWLKLVLGGVLGLFLFIYLFVTSLKYANPIDISIIMTLPPIFVILIGIIFLGRRPSMLEYIGVAVSFIGAAIVILDGASGSKGSDNLLGDILAIASTICYAFYLVILEKPTSKYKPLSLLRWVFLFAAIPALFLLGSFHDIPIAYTSDATPWIEISFILLCPTFIAYFLVQPAIKRVGSEIVSLYQYLIPVFATLSAVLMGIDSLKWMQVFAMLIIIVGMAFTTIGKRKRTKKIQNADSKI